MPSPSLASSKPSPPSTPNPPPSPTSLEHPSMRLMNWNFKKRGFCKICLGCFSKRFLTCFCFVMAALCSQARAQEPSIDEVADRLVQQFKKAEKKHFPPQVLVIDFASRPGGINAVGEYVANRLSDGLAQRIGTAAVINRKKLRNYVLTGGMSPLDLADRD